MPFVLNASQPSSVIRVGGMPLMRSKVENVEVEKVERAENVDAMSGLKHGDGQQRNQTALGGCRIFSFERGESCGSFQGARQLHRHHQPGPCMRTAPVQSLRAASL